MGEGRELPAHHTEHLSPPAYTTWPGSYPGPLGYHILLSMVARLLTVTECVPHWITSWLPPMLLSKATLVFLKRQQAYFLAFHMGAQLPEQMCRWNLKFESPSKDESLRLLSTQPM